MDKKISEPRTAEHRSGPTVMAAASSDVSAEGKVRTRNGTAGPYNGSDSVSAHDDSVLPFPAIRLQPRSLSRDKPARVKSLEQCRRCAGTDPESSHSHSGSLSGLRGQSSRPVGQRGDLEYLGAWLTTRCRGGALPLGVSRRAASTAPRTVVVRSGMGRRRRGFAYHRRRPVRDETPASVDAGPEDHRAA